MGPNVGKEESCLAEYKGAEEGMGVCTAASSVPNIPVNRINEIKYCLNVSTHLFLLTI